MVIKIKRKTGRRKTKATYNPNVKEYIKTGDDIQRLNNGQSIFMSTYKTDKKNNNIEDIYTLLNNKSANMAKNKVLKDASLKLNVLYKNIGWRSISTYQDAGKYFETSEEYDSLTGGGRSEILGFSIHFIV